MAADGSSALRRIGPNTTGIFSANGWLEEGDGHLVTARNTRAEWLWKRRAFPVRIKARGASARLWRELTGMPRASLLLLGYAVEMYLKAGLVKVYYGCREGMFERDVKRIYGHDLLRLAHEIEFPDANAKATELRLLQNMILEGARYPITQQNVMGSLHESNPRTQIWDQSRFRELTDLGLSIRRHAALIDQDESEPAHRYERGIVGNTGYWAYRIGGHLSPRVTYRLCRSVPTFGLNEVREAVEQTLKFGFVTKWERCRIYEDGETKTKVVQPGRQLNRSKE